MELNLLHPDLVDFPAAYEISPARQQELSRHLDNMVRKWGDDPVVVTTARIARDIALFCQGPEELSYCLTLHMGWHQRRGLQLTPRGPVRTGFSKSELIIHLTEDHLTQLRAGEKFRLNAKDVGLVDLPILLMSARTDWEILKAQTQPIGMVYSFPPQKSKE